MPYTQYMYVKGSLWYICVYDLVKSYINPAINLQQKGIHVSMLQSLTSYVTDKYISMCRQITEMVLRGILYNTEYEK